MLRLHKQVVRIFFGAILRFQAGALGRGCWALGCDGLLGIEFYPSSDPGVEGRTVALIGAEMACW